MKNINRQKISILALFILVVVLAFSVHKITAANNLDELHLTQTVVVKDGEINTDYKDKDIYRDFEEGPLFKVESGGKLILDNVTIDGTKGQYATTAAKLNQSNNALLIYNDGELDLNNSSVINHKSNISNVSSYALIFGNEGTIVFNNTTFSNNNIENNKGNNIYISNTGKLKLENNSIFTNNHSYKGGAIFSEGDLTINNSTFKENSSEHDGGAIYNNNKKGNDATFKISESIFENNTTESRGIVFSEGSVDVEKSTFKDNLGGAIRLQSGNNSTGEYTLQVEESLFDNNENDEGAAIIAFDNIKINKSKFINNFANDGSGGAILFYEWSGSDNSYIRDSVFEGNKSASKYYIPTGGAIYTGAIEINNSTFKNNSAKENGGALHIAGNTTIINSKFIDNNAGNEGGAIFINPADTRTEVKVKIDDAIIMDNKATNMGGAIGLCPTGEAVLNITRGVAILDNSADVGGDSIAKEHYKDGWLRLANYSLFGFKNEVFADNQDDRYKEGDKPLNSQDLDENAYLKIITKINNQSNYDNMTIFQDNISRKGGAIYNNAELEFGDDEWQNIKVLKEWQDLGHENQRPKDITVALMIGEEEVERVTLNDSNNWQYTFEKLPADIDYSIKEIIGDNYLSSQKQTSITEDEYGNKTISYTITNEYVETSNLLINKIDADTHKVLEGVQFNVAVCDSDDKCQDNNLLTDNNGEISLNKMNKNNYIIIKEIKALDRYILDGREIKIFYDNNSNTWRIESDIPDLNLTFNETNQTFSLEIKNMMKSELKLVKKDVKNNKVLAGAQFEFILGDKTFNMTSNNDGLISITDGLDGLNKVVIKELKAPNGYVLNNHEIILTYDSNNKEWKATNNEQFNLSYDKDNKIISLVINNDPKDPSKPIEPVKPIPETGSELMVFSLILSITGLGILGYQRLLKK